MSLFKKLLNMDNLKKFFYFGLVGGFGIVVNTVILYLLSQKAEMNYLVASAIATETAIVSNFIGNNYFTFKNQNKDEKIYKKFLSFQLISLISLFGTMFFLWLFVTSFGKELLLVWNVLAILIMFVTNFILNFVFTWKIKTNILAEPEPEYLSEEITADEITEKNLYEDNTGGKKEDKKEEESLFNKIFPAFLISLFCITALFTIIFSQSSYGLNSTNTSNSTISNLQILTNPGFVNISINSSLNNNSVINAISDANGTLLLENLTSGNNSVIATKINFTDFKTQINLLPGNNSINITLTQINVTNISNQTQSNSNITNNISNISNATDIVAVSDLGYHPLSVKEVVVYTNSLNGTFNIRDANTNSIMANFLLLRPLNYTNGNVNCQGNMPCLTGDFTNFTTQGTYYIEENGIKSHSFTINQNIFSSTIPLFFEFFNAELQQNSSYHADIHLGYSPPFSSMADGSFIMEADQAALPLIRLGSAYRRNPQIFQFDNYNILASGKPDTSEYIVSYVNYLEGLQGISVLQSNSPSAVRLGTGMLVNNIFVPGPTNLTSMNVYIPGNPPTVLQNAPVVSLCGANDNSAAWQTCINNAANIYKCQIDEPCLNITYNDRMGTITSNVSANGYAVSKGWSYEFGCYFDVNLNAGNFNNGNINPCHVFYNDTSRQYTSMTLLAFLEAIPAVNDFSKSKSQELLTRSINTYNYIKTNYSSFTPSDSDSGYFGAAAFLLYDYTNSSTYLLDAYNMRTDVSTTFISDTARGNEFYFEEYVRHKDAINALGVTYQLNGSNPEELFRGKMFQDYKDAGPTAISNNGERVFEFDRNVQFQNSRFMLIEGLLGVKTTELLPSSESFISVVAQNQLSWLTGMNLVQQGVGLNAPVKPMSFIFGIGDFPNQFHSRWLVDTGYSAATSGNVIGARGTGYQFFDSSNNTYVYFDGVSNILNDKLGALGNGWHNETTTDQFHVTRVFKNGKTYIPGWINGAFPAAADGDTIFNYNDDLHAYEYTETTNEIVATAIEYFSYLDGDLNNKPRYVVNLSNFVISNQTNSTITNTTQTNSTNTTITNSTNTTTTNSTSNQTQNNSNTTVKIISNSTSLSPIVSNGSIHYLMREDATASFSVISNYTNSIIWFIDGIEQNITVAKNATFLWTPGILWVPRAPDFSNTAASIITAQSQNAQSQNQTGIQNETISWNVLVDNVINPFFSSVNDAADIVGSPDSKIHVLTNNKYVSFTSVNVTILSDSGSTAYQLIKTFNNSNETEWTIYIPQLSFGNNYLTQIIGFNNATSQNATYDIGFARAHYVTPPVSSSSDTSSGGNTGSSGGSSGKSNLGLHNFNPKIIYALFGKDVLNVNDTQTLTLDAENFNQSIFGIDAKLITPKSDFQILNLKLVKGTNYYGTWQATFQSTLSGQYTLYSVEMSANYTQSSGSSLNTTQKEIFMQNQTFYSVENYSGDNKADVTSKLGLIYSVLSQSQVTNGTKVNIILDATDTLGILNVSAKINNTRGDIILVPLKLIRGNSFYGTWQGLFTVTKPDTTYTVNSVTLKNANDEKTYDLNDRSVYVLAIPNQQQTNTNQENGNLRNQNSQNSITGLSIQNLLSKDYWSGAIKNPLFPTILGFILMFIVIGIILVTRKGR